MGYIANKIVSYGRGKGRTREIALSSTYPPNKIFEMVKTEAEIDIEKIIKEVLTSTPDAH
jgi:hypothetical protein